jgi:hypothetical protein
MGSLRPHYSDIIQKGGGREEGDHDDNDEGEEYVPHKQEFINAFLRFVTGYGLGG